MEENADFYFWGRKVAKRVLFVLVIFFSLCCIKLCAESAATNHSIVLTKERTQFISKAKQLVGSPYVYGAVGPDSFDCSGLIYYAARESVQVQLPRTARAIYNFCKTVNDEDREPGDLLFFKTTNSGNVSHVAIYIGNMQFISAISDGPNAGVIVSSLNQQYWKTRYVSTGRFLAGCNEENQKSESKIVVENSENEEKSEEIKKEIKREEIKVAQAKETVNVAENKKSFGESFVFDGNILGGWSFFDSEKVGMNFRGVDADFFVSNTALPLNAGLGVMFRANVANKLFQMPVVLCATFNDFVRIYAGPVISFVNGKIGAKEVKSSVFPGIVGVAFSTPAIKAGRLKIQFVQDINYCFYNETDGSALPAKQAWGNGVSFYTGIRLIVPQSAFKKA